MIKIETSLSDYNRKEPQIGTFLSETAVVTVTVKLFGKKIWSRSERKTINPPIPNHPNCRCIVTPVD